MLYIYVLGYEVDFGHMEALNLITAQGYAEKTVGYLACVLLLSETNEFLRLVINSVKNDLASHNDEIQSLALACVANVGGREFAETLAPDVIYQVLHVVTGYSRCTRALTFENFCRYRRSCSRQRLRAIAAKKRCCAS
jgi:AP-2 complex subunit alpha